MSEPREAVADLLAHLRIHPDGGYSWFGERLEAPVPAAAALPAGAARALLATRLTRRLYADFYTQGVAVPSVDRSMTPATLGRADLVPALQAANTGAGAREDGWSARSRAGGATIAERDGLALTVPDGCLTRGALVLPKELLHRSPGHYTALGDRSPSPGRPLRRFYLHLTPRGAAPAVAALTGALNAGGIPFWLKVPADSSGYGRCDAGVLYVPRPQAGRVRALLTEIAGTPPAALRAGVPALTRPIGRGLAEADDPGGGESFGAHRCRLIADGAIAAWEAGRHDAAGRLAAVEARLDRAGVRLDAPWRTTAPAGVDAPA